MKFKIGEVLQIVKVNIPEDISSDSPKDYIGQLVTIQEVSDDDALYPYRVTFNDSFNGDYSAIYWAEDELDYPDHKFQEKVVWNKLIALNYDIMKLPMIYDYRLKGIYNLIEEYKVNRDSK